MGKLFNYFNDLNILTFLISYNDLLYGNANVYRYHHNIP